MAGPCVTVLFTFLPGVGVGLFPLTFVNVFLIFIFFLSFSDTYLLPFLFYINVQKKQ